MKVSAGKFTFSSRPSCEQITPGKSYKSTWKSIMPQTTSDRKICEEISEMENHTAHNVTYYCNNGIQQLFKYTN
jgi:hypothetical protein